MNYNLSFLKNEHESKKLRNMITVLYKKIDVLTDTVKKMDCALKTHEDFLDGLLFKLGIASEGQDVDESKKLSSI